MEAFLFIAVMFVVWFLLELLVERYKTGAVEQGKMTTSALWSLRFRYFIFTFIAIVGWLLFFSLWRYVLPIVATYIVAFFLGHDYKKNLLEVQGKLAAKQKRLDFHRRSQSVENPP